MSNKKPLSRSRVAFGFACHREYRDRVYGNPVRTTRLTVHLQNGQVWQALYASSYTDAWQDIQDLLDGYFLYEGDQPSSSPVYSDLVTVNSQKHLHRRAVWPVEWEQLK